MSLHEKDFCQDQMHKGKNNRWLAVNPYEVRWVMKTKFPQTEMVFGCVSSDSQVMPPHVFNLRSGGGEGHFYTLWLFGRQETGVIRSLLLLWNESLRRVTAKTTALRAAVFGISIHKLISHPFRKFQPRSSQVR